MRQKWIYLLITALLMSCPPKTQPQNGGGGSSTPPDTTAELPEPTRAPQKFALLVGIDRYKSPRISPLAGCVNDVEDMKALLIGKFEFKPENIKVLINEQATHEGIISAFRSHLIDQAQRDDIMVFHYSGHGSQMKDQPGEAGDEPDGRDETIVPHDSRTEGVFDISDDELNGLLRALSEKCKNVTYIFDSCHSGTVTRGSGRVRLIPADDRDPPPPPDFAFSARGATEGPSGLRPENLDYVLLSACLEKQSAFEHLANNQERGAFTYFLTTELRAAGSGVTYREVIDRIRGRVQLYYPNQLPQIEGTTVDNYVFSDAGSIAQPYFLANPLGETRIRLQGGQIHGLTSGSTVAVFPPGTRKFDDPAAATARATLTEVAAMEAQGKITEGSKIAEFSRAVITEQQFGNQQLYVYFDGLNASPKLQEIRAAAAGYNFIKVLSEPQGYHILIREKGGNIHMEAGDTSPLSPPLPVQTPELVQRMLNRLTAWARWFNLLSIDNPAAPDWVKLTVQKEVDGVPRDPFANLPTNAAELKDGDIIQCRIENTSGREFYVSLLILSSDGSIAVLYPPEDMGVARVKRDTTIVVPLQTFVPEDRPRVVDVYKVFATKEPVDFRVLTQPPVRSGSAGGELRNEEKINQMRRNPLGELLTQATLGLTRGARPVQVSDWQTVMRVLRVEK